MDYIFKDRRMDISFAKIGFSVFLWRGSPSYNTEFPQLEDDASVWDAAGTLKSYVKWHF